MRHAVKKPKAAAKHLKNTNLTRQPVSDIAVKKSVKQIDSRRLRKAQAISQSKLIHHFAPLTVNGDSIQVKVHPALPLTPSAQTIEPINLHPQHRPVHKTKPRTTADLLEHALNNATSHQQPPHLAKKRSHKGKAAAATAAFLVVVGYLGYQQLPEFRLHMAATRAGISASLPGYKPAGYSMAQLNYSPGTVTSRFNSNSDQRAYIITEKASSWDSQSLLENFVSPADKHYQVVTTGGRTVFVYGRGNATWVDGGIWYQIQGGDSLSNDQLVQLAGSL